MNESLKILAICTLALGLSSCAQSLPTRNPIINPQLESLNQQGTLSSLQIFDFKGCKQKGFQDSFEIAKKIDLISLSYVGTIYNQGSSSDVVKKLATDALVESSTNEIELLKYVAKKADNMGCKSQERKAYNMIMESAVYKSPIDFIFGQDLYLAQVKLNQLGKK